MYNIFVIQIPICIRIGENKMEDLKKEIENIKIRNKRVELDKKWETSYTRKICICILTYMIVVIYSNMINKSNNIFLSSLVPVIRIHVIYFIFKIYKKNLGEKSKIESQCMAFYF